MRCAVVLNESSLVKCPIVVDESIQIRALKVNMACLHSLRDRLVAAVMEDSHIDEAVVEVVDIVVVVEEVEVEDEVHTEEDDKEPLCAIALHSPRIDSRIQVS